MTSTDTVREEVSRSYAKAVSKPSGGGCCGGTEAKGVAAKVAGYSPEELKSVPQDAAVNSFGCGNPVAFSEVKPGDVVLDLGSGAGIDLILAAEKVGPKGRVIGIDMTDEMIARANDNIRKSGHDNIEVRKGIIEQMPVEDNSVDWVISNCVINLSPEKPRVFAEIARVLKPGGRMLVSDIVAEKLPEEIQQSKALYSSCVAGAISESAYLAGLRDAGLTDVEVRGRIGYDANQICGLVESELTEGGCCGSTPDGELAKKAARAMEGKVWSANVYARKP